MRPRPRAQAQAQGSEAGKVGVHSCEGWLVAIFHKVSCRMQRITELRRTRGNDTQPAGPGPSSRSAAWLAGTEPARSGSSGSSVPLIEASCKASAWCEIRLLVLSWLEPEALHSLSHVQAIICAAQAAYSRSTQRAGCSSCAAG